MLRPDGLMITYSAGGVASTSLWEVSMCFSATASFAVAAVLLPAGAYGLLKARRTEPEWIPLAAYPIAFAVQQAVEGLLWLGVNANDPTTIAAASRGFLFFSHFFWLAWVPISMYWIEKDRKRRVPLLALSGLGILFGLSLFLPLLLRMDWLSIELVQQSIEYKTVLIYDGLVDRRILRAFYALIIVSSLFLSSDRRVRVFAALVTASLIVAYLFFAHAFISVWCFFAAILSAYLVAVFAMERRRTLVPAQ